MVNFQSKLADKIAAAQAQQDIAYDNSLDQLLENPAFIETQRVIEAKAKDLRLLSTMIHQLNSITPFVANDGTKYSVTVYPISFFGHGLGELLGIVSSSRSAFTDDLMLQYSAITGISLIELAEAENALGRPAYCQKDGTFVDATKGDLTKLRQLLQSIAIKMGLKTVDIDSLNQDRYDLWYARAELVANKKASDFIRTAVLDTVRFTMAD